MSKHEHGSMNVDEQNATFDGFIRWSIRISVVSIAVLIFMALVNS